MSHLRFCSLELSVPSAVEAICHTTVCGHHGCFLAQRKWFGFDFGGFFVFVFCLIMVAFFFFFNLLVTQIIQFARLNVKD